MDHRINFKFTGKQANILLIGYTLMALSAAVFGYCIIWIIASATGSDQLVGFAMMALGFIVFGYYTMWVVIMPFVFEGHPIKAYFLPPFYAFVIPVVAGVVVLLGLSFFILYVLQSKKHATKKTN